MSLRWTGFKASRNILNALYEGLTICSRGTEFPWDPRPADQRRKQSELSAPLPLASWPARPCHTWGRRSLCHTWNEEEQLVITHDDLKLHTRTVAEPDRTCSGVRWCPPAACTARCSGSTRRTCCRSSERSASPHEGAFLPLLRHRDISWIEACSLAIKDFTAHRSSEEDGSHEDERFHCTLPCTCDQ